MTCALRRSLLRTLLALSIPATAAAQDIRSLPLSAAQYEIDVLTADAPAAVAELEVEAADRISILITATGGSLITSIDAPDGTHFDATTIEGMGGSFSKVIGPVTPQSPSLLPQLFPGEHFEYEFPSFGAGTYEVNFKAGAVPAEAVVVMTRIVTDSACRAALFAVDEQVPLGAAAVLTAAVFDGSIPVAGADVEVTVSRDGGAAEALVLRDDGGEVDDAAGDGLYSGSYGTQALGLHRASARITGQIGGSPFARQAAAQFEVVDVPARPNGTVSDRGVDENFNGLFDVLRIDAGIEVERAGDFNVYVHLQSASGTRISRATTASLPLGMQLVSVDFEADAIVSLGEDGPYAIERIEVAPLNDATAPSAARDDVSQTQAYLLSQFDGSPYEFTGAVIDQGLDDDGDGRLDRLRVSFQVSLSGRAGRYAWTLVLADAAGNPIELGSGSAVLVASRLFLEVTFSGAAIAASGINGPYRLLDLVLEGPRGFLRVADLGDTAAYGASSFALVCEGDCAGDGQVESDDLRLLVSYGLRGSVPEDCSTADVERDALITVEEIVFSLRQSMEGCP